MNTNVTSEFRSLGCISLIHFPASFIRLSPSCHSDLGGSRHCWGLLLEKTECLHTCDIIIQERCLHLFSMHSAKTRCIIRILAKESLFACTLWNIFEDNFRNPRTYDRRKTYNYKGTFWCIHHSAPLCSAKIKFELCKPFGRTSDYAPKEFSFYFSTKIYGLVTNSFQSPHSMPQFWIEMCLNRKE